MKYIEISTPKYPGTFALVDDEDYERLSAYHWYAFKGGRNLYACRNAEHGIQVKMHRVILSAPKGKLVDHIDGNSLNNQKANLRLCSRAENGRNRKTPNRNNKSSRFKGVWFNRKGGVFMAKIVVQNERIYLGQFASEIDAAAAYNSAAVQYHGEFASLNNLMAGQ